MKSQSGITNFFRKIGALIVMAILLFGCTTSPEIPQNPIVKPTKTKSSPAPNAPYTPESDDPPIKTFSIIDANRIAPDDVIQEVSFSGTGGGVGYEFDNYDRPTVDNAEKKSEWMQSTFAVVCGWGLDEKVNATIIFPDNTKTTQTLSAIVDIQGNYYIWFEFKPSVDSPLGIYTISFEGKSGYADYKISYYLPTGPRLYIIHDIQALFLYNFSPNEKIRLFHYIDNNNNTLKLEGWKEFQTDANGKLLIKVATDNGVYVVLRDKSGLVRQSGTAFIDQPAYLADIRRGDVLGNSNKNIDCSSTLPSRLKVGEYAYVATDPPLDNRIREEAGTDYSIIGYIATGNAMKILDGPKCANGWAWWKVQSIKKSDLVGWTSEGDDTYWLIPCKTLDSCP